MSKAWIACYWQYWSRSVRNRAHDTLAYFGTLNRSEPEEAG